MLGMLSLVLGAILRYTLPYESVAAQEKAENQPVSQTEIMFRTVAIGSAASIENAYDLSLAAGDVIVDHLGVSGRDIHKPTAYYECVCFWM